ncbi:MAG: hypothetical protein ACRED9_06875 [Caulobacteraceae bacterium]
MTPEHAKRLQRSYAARRRAWARKVGRPYPKDRDPRPPPGEIEPPAVGLSDPAEE